MPFSPSFSPWLGATVGVVSAVAIVAPAAIAQTFAVQTAPANPQLGDTISVFITGASAQPTVQMGGQTYPAFALGGDRYRAMIPTSPLEAAGGRTIAVQTPQGERQTVSVNVRGRSFPTQRIWLSGGGSSATEYELARVAQFKTLVTPEKYWSGPLKRPSQGGVSTIYGVRRYYNGVFAQNYYHRGVDYAAGTGTPVFAPAAGYIGLVDRESNGFRVHGNTVGIDHGQGVLSIMLHLHTINVQEGQFVQAGQRIGTVGSTGASTGPHLHWGLYVHGVAIDPVPWRFEGLE
ncbi:MAG: M23 family metallopeptidase [Spirulina sp. SIO3F2]|nr:M23 family metallopeptidase [Spirulina sp. SIO3F2]